ncbi:MAG: biotin--[acetyl-CoA-carboxylase] ligase [Candidatus Omnitrophota bacterium]|jgi:BirA family biotin operon repressor/biotin-[acetyl-CoA-carboxylase] ligase|nr:MAG: biotin--[acetyl-CoA-carboxylase] ligase [Candidatus Omnitrophota bacterium]
MQDKIVNLLKRRSGYVSGEEIAHHLGISRQGLWKHIQDLRNSGYDIVAIPHLGYELVSLPDRLFASEITSGLNTKFIGRKIYYFDHLSSTMEVALQLGLKNAPEGTLVLAEGQSKGRGRLGRSWISPKFKGIYLSVILRPKISPNAIPVITLLSAVSICEAIHNITGLSCQIKWPNDVLIANKKVSGVLTELNAEADQTSFVIIGAGINVNNDKKDLIASATSLKEHKKSPIDRVKLLQEVLARLEHNYIIFQKGSSAPVLERWREFSSTLNRRIRINSYRLHIEGQAIDIDSDGALMIREDSGIIRKVTAGDITHCR